MGKTFKRGDRWKKDRRDNSFQKSKKFKHIKQGSHQKPTEKLPTDDIEDNDSYNT